jgi:hypothetical protein
MTLATDWEAVSGENAQLKQDASRFGRKYDAIKSEQVSETKNFLFFVIDGQTNQAAPRHSA